MADFKIFFSWQSDLSKNKTTGFIDECLDAVSQLLKDTVTVRPDRGTQGLTGSPDITESIFHKIDNCDLFVADLSIVNHFSVDKQKKLTPNPNVLLETGYAARALEWSRVICLYNEEFGSPSEYPFDIDHRRLTPFRFTASSREKEKGRIARIIADHVVQLTLSGGVQRRGKAYYQIGGFDFESNSVTDVITPHIIRQSQFYIQQEEELIGTCKNHVLEIQEIHLISEEEKDLSSDPIKKDPMKALALNLTGTSIKKRLKQDDIESMRDDIDEFLHMQVSDDFFNLGDLATKKDLVRGYTEYEGTKQEKRKIELIDELSYCFLRLKLMDLFAETFEGLCLVPLAIKNISTEADRNVQINIRIKDNCANAITPTRELFNDAFKSDNEHYGYEGIVYDEGLIESCLKMPSNSYIQYDDCAFDRGVVLPEMPWMEEFGLGTSRSNVNNYETELQVFVKEPISEGEYQYEINAIRPGEVMWLGPMIILKPNAQEMHLTYSIISHNTNGDLQGEIVVK